MQYIATKVTPNELKYYSDIDTWALLFTSSYTYPVTYISDTQSQAVSVQPTTLQIYEYSLGTTKFDTLPINGWLNVRAFIDERPQEDEKNITVEVVGDQEQYDQTVYNLAFNAYSFQTYRTYSFL